MASKAVPPCQNRSRSSTGERWTTLDGVMDTPNRAGLPLPTMDGTGRSDGRPCTREAQAEAGRTVDSWPQGKNHRKVKGQRYASKTPTVKAEVQAGEPVQL